MTKSSSSHNCLEISRKIKKRGKKGKSRPRQEVPRKIDKIPSKIIFNQLEGAQQGGVFIGARKHKFLKLQLWLGRRIKEEGKSSFTLHVMDDFVCCSMLEVDETHGEGNYDEAVRCGTCTCV